MIKRLIAVLGTAAVVGLLGLFVVGTVFAQGPTPATPQTPWGGAWGGVCRGAGVVSDAITKLLGMTQDQIYAERAEGKTLFDIAKEKGVTDQQLIDAMLASRQEAIDQAVKDGQITQEQADWMIAKMKAMAPFELTSPLAPGAGRGGMGRGHGRWGQAAPVTSGTSSS